MKTWTLPVTALALFLTVGSVPAQGDCSNPSPGPDVIVGSLSGVGNYGGTGGVGGYSLGTTSCNIGTQTLLWIASNNQHPVIGQGIFRMKNGRFEQLGMSWLKHGFTALQGNVCCNCTPNPNGSALGVGCSDPYSSSLNGSQGGLGPRYQVNAYTGAFSYPFFAQGQSGNVIYKRIQVANSDLDPAQNAGALYFGEGQYITPDDSAAGNGANNSSYRQMTVGSFSSGSWNMSMTGPTERTKPALRAWADNDPGVTYAEGKVPGEGAFVCASKVTDNGNGTWHYEYAIQNLTSDVAIGSFSVPFPAGTTISNPGFHDVAYHSGEPFDGTDWVGQQVGNSFQWATAQTFAQNANANAIRWGTLYNFWFDADVGPGEAPTTVGFFKPHSSSSTGIKLDVPTAGTPTWVDLGGGTSGIGGPPTLTMSGPLTAASTLSLDMVDGPASTLALIFISATSTPTSFLGGTLHAFPFDVLLIVGTDAGGELHGAATFDGAASGTELYFQVGLADASVPVHGASLSNGVKGTVP